MQNPRQIETQVQRFEIWQSIWDGSQAETERRALMTQEARELEDAQADAVWSLQHGIAS